MNILGFISGTILAIVFGSIIAVIVLLVGIALFMASRQEKRQRQHRIDTRLLSDYYYDVFYGEFRKRYIALPNFAMRRKFLQEECPEFWSALQRAMSFEQRKNDPEIHFEERCIAKFIDFRCLKWQSHGYVLDVEESFDLYHYNTDLSLPDLQMRIDEEQEKKQEREASRVARAQEREALRVKLESERLAKVKAEKEAAKLYWESLSDEDKESFKNAKGRSARERVLPKPTSSDYTTDMLYPVIISTYFSGLSPNTSNSITDCETASASSSSSYSSSDSSYSYDSGSSYSSSDSSSSCDGGSF